MVEARPGARLPQTDSPATSGPARLSSSYRLGGAWPSEAPSLGIVVPVFNEAKILAGALGRLRQLAGAAPIVVVDGGSSDGSERIAQRFYPVEALGEPNRGAQLNCGARHLSTQVLLFLHADSQLPAEDGGGVAGSP